MSFRLVGTVAHTTKSLFEDSTRLGIFVLQGHTSRPPDPLFIVHGPRVDPASAM